jgi:hypothetical protein
MNQKLLALYGLKWNPFTPEVSIEALYVAPKITVVDLSHQTTAKLLSRFL